MPKIYINTLLCAAETAHLLLIASVCHVAISDSAAAPAPSAFPVICWFGACGVSTACAIRIGILRQPGAGRLTPA